MCSMLFLAAKLNLGSVAAGIFGLLYKPSAWADGAKQLLQAYQSLVAAANALFIVETPTYIKASLRPWEWTRTYLSPQAFKHRSPRLPTLKAPRAINMDSTIADATWQIKSLGVRGVADSPLYDFGGSTVAIACGDAIDTPNTTTVDVFGEIVYTASMASQMFGPEWFPTMYCHRCVSFSFCESVDTPNALTPINFRHVHRWPPRAVERFQDPWNHKLANKILVIGNKGDPVTPLANAKKVAELLGPSNAVLLERDGYGVSVLISTFTTFISA